MGWSYRGDARRPARGDRIVADIARTGSLVVREFGGGRAGEIAAHRFLGSPEVNPGAIFADVSARTALACAGRRVVAAQDTTEINFSGADRSRPGLGLAGDGKSLGFFIHPVVAIDAQDGSVLGLAGARIWTRSLTKVGNNQKRPIEDKESLRWIEAAETAAETRENRSPTRVGHEPKTDSIHAHRRDDCCKFISGRHRSWLSSYPLCLLQFCSRRPPMQSCPIWSDIRRPHRP